MIIRGGRNGPKYVLSPPQVDIHLLALQRLKREHRCWRLAEHPNVVTFYGVAKPGVIEAAPSPGLVSPYMQNGTISSFLYVHKNNPGVCSPQNRLKLVCEEDHYAAFEIYQKLAR